MIKFFVEFQLNPGNKGKVLALFELRGPNRHPGVELKNAWIGKKEEVIFVLAESADETLLLNAAKAWGEFGAYKITPVIDLDQY